MKLFSSVLFFANVLFCLSELARGQFNYCVEFLEPEVFAACDDHPDYYLDKAVDMSTISIQHSSEGNLLVNGSVKMIKSFPADLPVKIETFKKERGEWQPTVFTSKRKDVCIAAFDDSELWAKYWENTPDEQKTCPLTEGQNLDLNISEEISFNLPTPNIEGEYKSRLELGTPSDDFYLCTDVFIVMHRL
ncbi:uncharacterized protein [Musca autumnalis]|uniref:uncharacterized protein n=1 Tax=Musca autumnalis TaxID=221902 RepID=UPI003CF8B5CD